MKMLPLGELVGINEKLRGAKLILLGKAGQECSGGGFPANAEVIWRLRGIRSLTPIFGIYNHLSVRSVRLGAKREFQ